MLHSIYDVCARARKKKRATEETTRKKLNETISSARAFLEKCSRPLSGKVCWMKKCKQTGKCRAAPLLIRSSCDILWSFTLSRLLYFRSKFTVNPNCGLLMNKRDNILDLKRSLKQYLYKVWQILNFMYGQYSCS